MPTVAPKLVHTTYAGRVLELRPPSPMDAPALFEAMESSLPELQRFLPFAHAPNTIASQYERLVQAQRDYWGGGDKVFHLWEGLRFIGCFGLHRRTLNTAGLELGFWVRSEAAGQGIATHVAQCLVVLCFEHLGCERLQLGYSWATSAANERSRRIMEKCGFVLEGRLRHFETAPTPDMIARGASEERTSVMGSIVRDDLPGLAWYARVCDGLGVVNWREA